jgi:hypothetical protein
MENIYRKLEIIDTRIYDDELNSIFELNDDEMTIAQEFYDCLLNKVFSLNSIDFVVPFLKSVEQSRFIDNIYFALCVDNNSTLATKYIKIINKNKLSFFFDVGIKTYKENKVFETLRLHNYLTRRIYDVCKLFNIDESIFLKSKYISEYILEEDYETKSDDSLTSREDLIKELETLKDKQTEFETNGDIEIEFSSQSLYLAFLHKIGVVQYILDSYCVAGNTYNWTTGANIIKALSFVGNSNHTTIRKCISDIINDERNKSEKKSKNNPFSSDVNTKKVSEMLEKLNIDKK